jgi:amphi-Trp domain-containing protein
MGREKKLFTSEERMNLEGASAFLHQLADKVAEGQIFLRQGQQEIILQLPQYLVLEVQVEEEEKRGRGLEHKLEVELKWFEGDTGGGPLELG